MRWSYICQRQKRFALANFASLWARFSVGILAETVRLFRKEIRGAFTCESNATIVHPVYF